MPQAAELLPEVIPSPKFQHHGAPICRCGSRDSVRIGESALTRQCQQCGRTFMYRVCNGHVVPFAPETAASFDQERAVSRWSVERMTSFLKRAGVQT